MRRWDDGTPMTPEEQEAIENVERIFGRGRDGRPGLAAGVGCFVVLWALVFGALLVAFALTGG